MKALNSFVALAVLGLSGLVAWQTMEMTALESAKAQAERDLKYGVAKLAADSMTGRREEFMRAATWLNDFYRSPEGLQRPDGLWLTDRGQPDIEAIVVWIFDVYQSARIAGKSEEESRRVVANAIRGTDEWRRKHPGSN